MATQAQILKLTHKRSLQQQRTSFRTIVRFLEHFTSRPMHPAYASCHLPVNTLGVYNAFQKCLVKIRSKFAYSATHKAP